MAAINQKRAGDAHGDAYITDMIFNNTFEIFRLIRFNMV
jgi:hypothetical protein